MHKSQQDSFRVPPPVVADIRKSSYDGLFNVSCKGIMTDQHWIQNISGGRGAYHTDGIHLTGYPGPRQYQPD